MCLEFVEKVYDDYEDNEEIEGYQAKRKHPKDYSNEMMSPGQRLSMNEWVESHWTLSWENPGGGAFKYRPGFHISGSLLHG